MHRLSDLLVTKLHNELPLHRGSAHNPLWAFALKSLLRDGSNHPGHSAICVVCTRNSHSSQLRCANCLARWFNVVIDHTAAAFCQRPTCREVLGIWHVMLAGNPLKSKLLYLQRQCIYFLYKTSKSCWQSTAFRLSRAIWSSKTT